MLGLLHGTQSAPGTFPGNYYWFTVTHPEYCPHVLWDPQSNDRHRFIPPNQPSKALRNLAGGVETNNRPGGVYQIEIVGMSEDFWAYPDWWYDRLRTWIAEESTYAGVELIFTGHNRRFSFAEWMSQDLRGWYGHYNVPENDHWDPGTLDLTRLATPQEPEMELSDPVPVQNHDVHGNPTGAAPGTVGKVLSWTHDEASRGAGAARDARDNALAAVSHSQAASVKADQILDLLRAAPMTDLQTIPTQLIVDELSRRLGIS